ncbi:succinate dehydrogenase cytochrome b560 subunit [Aspergillus campestris IBT 28561]|uniref:Succinate dehydrogenase cytochrome b560 subunit n=1 Tax=Aspergillus campestris (strain IBT 28561) TaxID=1392248 RepID=A0A2I1D8X1_ASPC2|nr:succinate dehydrogenase cytochrome b560 subunit [Aspergillus campestris IBT 28561]PKY06317.1 succinate dehydrogenase cytochrome b560 subunit [Aspergillus campestris IBT 28561]
MLSQKVAQQSLRRLAVQQPYAMRWAAMNAASPATIAMGRNVQTRFTASTTNTQDPTKILAQQRLNRPVSPHLSIYKPQITWIGSSIHRITGLVMSGPLYLFATAYLASPLLGWHLESASMAAAFGALPLAAKVILKTAAALPFTYHCMNGVRHLLWDLCIGITNQQVIKSGWTVVGLSTISALSLALLY